MPLFRWDFLPPPSGCQTFVQVAADVNFRGIYVGYVGKFARTMANQSREKGVFYLATGN